MNTHVISDTEKRDILAMLDEYQPYLHTEVEQIDLLRRKLEGAVVVSRERLSPTIVTMGSTIRLVDLLPRQEETYTLVYPQEASPGLRRISVLSPLGTALLGCEQGSIVEVDLPTRSIPFAIREVRQPASDRDQWGALSHSDRLASSERGEALQTTPTPERGGDTNGTHNIGS